MRTWMVCAGVTVLVGMLLWALTGCGHDPNHDINRAQARAAANRVHKPPPPGTKRIPGFGG